MYGWLLWQERLVRLQLSDLSMNWPRYGGTMLQHHMCMKDAYVLVKICGSLEYNQQNVVCTD